MSDQAVRHPAIELLARYRAVFKAVWSARHELAGPKRLTDEAAFLPAALSLQETPVHPAPLRAAWIIMTLFAIALVWSIVGEVDIVAVAQGRVTVSDNTKVIQSLEPGVVQAIRVRDGDHVTQGQVLIELDATGAGADVKSAQDQLEASKREALLSQVELKALQSGGAQPRVQADGATMTQLQIEWSDITANLAKLDAELQLRIAEHATANEVLAKLQATLPIAKQREADYKSLSQQGFMSGHAEQDRARERIELERDLATQIAKVKETQATLVGTRTTRAGFVAETQKRLSDRYTQATLRTTQLEQELVKGERRKGLTHLTSPVSGTVQQLAIHTTGGVVTSAQQLMVVVPDDAEVRAEVLIDNKDIGFVRVGQPAEIKLETFGFTRYGTVPASVTWFTADAVNDEKRGAIFPATLKLDKSVIDVDGRAVRLAPGMNLSAEVKTGRQRVIEYLWGPVIGAMKSSLRER